MTNYKFRQHLKPAYRAKGDIFHYWGFIDGGFVSPVGKNISIHNGDQYTGLKDQNGIEIYEGDIMLELYSGLHEKHSVKKVVLFDEKWAGFAPMCYLSSRGCVLTVIGNIYENPELLEVVK